MSRTAQDLVRMQGEDTAVGLIAHYEPMRMFIINRNYKSGVEVGTAYGGLANHILSRTFLDSLITVDPFLYYPDMPGLFDQDDYDRLRIQTEDRLRKFPQCQMMRMDSKEAYFKLKDYKVDFVFLDGLHKYETIKWECEHYQNLLKPGGALMGHDYNLFEDVNKAVDEFAKGKELFTLPGNIWYLNY